jgi:hypothetical protein
MKEVFLKVNLNVWQTCHDLFQISVVPVWFRSHHIFECYIFSGYRASTMSHQTSPTLHWRQPPCPHLYGSTNFTYLLEKTLVWLNYHIFVKKQRENLYGWGVITCKRTIIHVCKIVLIRWHFRMRHYFAWLPEGVSEWKQLLCMPG